MQRRGAVFVGVLIASVVLFIGVLAFHFFMRQTRWSAHRSLHGEQAHALARAGMELAQIHLTRALADATAPLRQVLLQPRGQLAGRSGELGKVDLWARFPALVDRLARSIPRGSASVTGLEARFGILAGEVAPLPPLSLGDRTLERGEREKRGVLFVDCIARLSTGGPFGELTRQVRGLYEFRVEASTVPLLSDFALYARERPARPSQGSSDPFGNLGVDGAGNSVKGVLTPMSERGWVYLGDAPGGTQPAVTRPPLPPQILPASWAGPLGGLELGRLSLEDLAPQLSQVACWNVPQATDYTAFLRSRGMLDGGALDLGTTVRGAGDLKLPALSSVRRGGMLIADRITITGAIPRPERGVVVLVATGGSITVPAGVPVHAELVALKGPVVLSGAVELRGSVAAARLDCSGVTPGSRITYDERFKERAFGPGPGDNLIVDFARKPMRVE